MIAAAVLLGGCGDDTTTMAANDLATVSDLSVPADLTMLSCSHVLACVAGCGQNLACQASCRDAGTTAAKSAYDAFTGCVAASCSSVVDGGSAACLSATDTRPACETCLQNTATQAPNAGADCHDPYVSCASS
jgi:hypothetical protein